MKIRTGFVSNSSSSSFIITFDKVPKSKEELQTLLFGERAEYHYSYGTEFFPTDMIADIVWNDIQKDPATLEDAKETIRRGSVMLDFNVPHLSPMPEIRDFETRSGETFSEKFDEAAYEEAYEKYCAQFYCLLNEDAINEGRCFIVEYSDNDGMVGSAMEHGTLFDRIYSIKVSHH